jgi:hypothetical protein
VAPWPADAELADTAMENDNEGMGRMRVIPRT